MSQQKLLDAANAFFIDFSKGAPPATLLLHFSTTQPIVIQHSPAFSQRSQISRLSGSNAVRSYFDLLATHWTRTPVAINHTEACSTTNTVIADASITWTWRCSQCRWQEDLICTITYDESFKIVSLNLQTVSEPETCVMQAVDPQRTEIPKDWNEKASKGFGGRWDWSRHV